MSMSGQPVATSTVVWFNGATMESVSEQKGRHKFLYLAGVIYIYVQYIYISTMNPSYRGCKPKIPIFRGPKCVAPMFASALVRWFVGLEWE
jgi:hypothetical protein